MSDYTATSRLFAPNGLLHGVQPIQELFVMLLKEFAKPGMSFEMLRQDVEGDTAYIIWKAETADNRYEIGADTFLVKGGRSRPRHSRGRSHQSTEASTRPT
jgi:hypothetical protein